MTIFETFITKPEDLEEKMNKIRKEGIPDLFNQKFLEEIGFKKPNCILYVSLFKTLGLVDKDEKPVSRYYSLFIKSEETSKRIVAERVKETYSTVFKEEPQAFEISSDQVHSLFRKMMQPEKSSTIVSLVADTFFALTKYAGAREFLSRPADAFAEDRGNGLAINTNGALETAETPHEEFILELMNGCRDHKYSTPRHPAPEKSNKNHQNGAVIHMPEKNGQSGFLQDAMMSRANLLERLDRWEEAVAAYDEIIACAGQVGTTTIQKEYLETAIYRKADVLERLEKYDEAIVAYDELIQRYY